MYIMKKFLTIVISILLLFSMFGTANALIFTDLYGDKDSFGTGKPIGQNVSAYEILATSPSVSDGDFDQWSLNSFNWTHNIVLPANAIIIGATLEVYSFDMEDNGAGDGLGGAPYDDKLFLDGVELLGAFDTVFTPDGTGATLLPPNKTILSIPNTFYGSILDGSLNVILDPLGGTLKDAIALDYAELKVDYTVVPEPGTMLLLGTGIIGLVGFRRKVKTS